MSELYRTTESPRSLLDAIWLEIGHRESRTVVLDCDLFSATRTEAFAEAFPGRFFEMGIGEQNAMSAAGGLAIEGLIPFYANFSFFLSGTCWTQLRQNCFSELNVKLIATHPGMDNGPDGGTHHANEEIALTRTLPGLTVLSPSDHFEVRAAFLEALAIHGPVYIRVPRDETPVLHDDSCGFPVGHLELLRDEGEDFAIIYEGSASLQACGGFERLRKRGLAGKLISARTLKPFDTKEFRRLASGVGALASVENHSVMGGLGGLVAESLGETPGSALGRVGVRDVYTQSGRTADVKRKFGLSAEAVEASILEILDRKESASKPS